MVPDASTIAGPVFTAERSASASSVVVALLLLLVGSGSAVVLDTMAVLTMSPVASAPTSNVTVTVTLAPRASVPSAHGKPPAHGAVAEAKVRPAGLGSSRVTPLAGDGPLLITLTG